MPCITEDKTVSEKKSNKKQGRRILFWLLAAAVVAALAAMPMLASRQEESGQEAAIRSDTAQKRSMETKIVGGGQLQGEKAQNVKIPAEVKLTEYLVGNGDTVLKGQPIASVDRVSVMEAIASVQKTLDTLSKKIAAASSNKAPETIKALAAGTVKQVFAQKGDDAQAVMLQSGALAVLSLDGTMSVQLTVSSSLEPGDGVLVSVAGGQSQEGRVTANQDGVLTVSVTDNHYAVGTQAAVKTKEGASLGTGSLYITSPWNASAYSGTVSQVDVAAESSVYSGQTLLRLTDTGHSAEYQSLIDQRREYEDLMQELFRLYETETLTAPCDGIVTNVDKEGTFLLAADGTEWKLSLLTGTSNEAAGFRAYAARVVSVSAEGMELLSDPWGVAVTDVRTVSALTVDAGALTASWHYTGACPVYAQGEDGLLHEAESVEPGDILLAVEDDDTLYWFVRLDESRAPAAASAGLTAHLLSSTQPTEDADTILTTSLQPGVVGQAYTATLQAAEGLTGLWTAEGLPKGLTLDEKTGVISGVPEQAGTFPIQVTFTVEETPAVKLLTLTVAESAAKTYYGYPAKIIRLTDGAAMVKQSKTVYPVTDLKNLPKLEVNEAELTEEKIYTGEKVNALLLKEGDLVLVIVDEDENLVQISALPTDSPDKPGGGNTPGGGGFPSGMISFGSYGGGSKQGQQSESLYSLDKLTVASVTAQAQMTLEITVDELDITKIHVGQTAVVSVDALAGEHFPAVVSQISNSGTNSGGSSKFTVELTLTKNGDMLPNMNASASITLETLQDALCVPVSALAEENGKTVVYTALDEKTGSPCNPVEVTIGAADADFVQILSGLQEGDTVYYAYYEAAQEQSPAGAGTSGFPMVTPG